MRDAPDITPILLTGLGMGFAFACIAFALCRLTRSPFSSKVIVFLLTWGLVINFSALVALARFYEWMYRS